MSSELRAGSSELRTVLEGVLEQPLVEPSPVEHVMRRGRRIVNRHRRRRAVARFLVLVLMATAGLRAVVLDGPDDHVRVTDGPDPPVASTTTTTMAAAIPYHAGPAPAPPRVTAEHQPDPSPPSPVAARPSAAATGDQERCRPSENGSSDVGVTANSIRLAVGIEAIYAVRSAADRVNRAGGVCGRAIDVVAGSLGVDVFTGVEPYAPSGSSLGRITAHHAYRDLGARTFALVHDRAHADVAAAVAEYVRGLPGASLRVSQSMESGNLGPAVAAVAQACPGGCDAMLLAMAPAGITSWLDAGGPTARRETAALPSAVNAKWPHDCVREAGERCREVAVWTPFKLPGVSLDQPDLRQYEWDAKSVGAHPQDATFQAWYVGMRRLAAAMHLVGSDLTRARLHEALASVAYESGLVGPPHTARELRMDMEDGRFVGWRDVSENWHRDPLVPAR